MPHRRPPRPTSELLDADYLGELPLPVGTSGIELRRSPRRRKTVTARIEGDRVVILLPAHLGDAAERDWVVQMVRQLVAKRARPAQSDADLERRAELLAGRHLDNPAGRAVRPTQIKWVTNMAQRWGSCSTDSGQIRLSHRLQRMPEWVIDYVIVHELAHLIEPGHGPDFQALVAGYPQSDRARGYLEGFLAGQGIPAEDGDAAVGEEAGPAAG